MKIDDFMDALGNVDPKYIEESAVELNDASMQNIIAFRKKKAAKKRRVWAGCISAAACLTLIILVKDAGFLERTKDTQSKNEYMEMASPAQMEEAQEVEADWAETACEPAKEFAYDEAQDSNSDNMVNSAELMESEDEIGYVTTGEGDTLTSSTGGASLDEEIGSFFEGISGEHDIKEKDVEWENSEFLEGYQIASSETVTFDEYELFHYELSQKFDIINLSVYEYGEDEIVFARSTPDKKLYAYYVRDHKAYLIVGETVNVEDFLEGVQEILDK